MSPELLEIKCGGCTLLYRSKITYAEIREAHAGMTTIIDSRCPRCGYVTAINSDDVRLPTGPNKPS